MNIEELLEITKNQTIVAATKYVDTDKMIQLYNKGFNNFGENRVDVFTSKYDKLSNLDVKWHFIGSLQTRKVKDVINKIDYLHSLDRLSLAQEIEKRSDKELKCFIQLNLSREENKHGLLEEELFDFVSKIINFKRIKIVGLMTMAANTKDESVISATFQKANELLDTLNKTFNLDCKYLSMGMSQDYQIAIKNNATHLRLGSILFKE